MSSFNLNFPPYSHDFLKRGMFFQMFKAYPTPTPSMRVRINSGHFWLNNESFVDWNGGLSPTIIAPSQYAYWALITINYKLKVANVVYGTASLNPEPPECPSEHLPIAWIYLEGTTTQITRSHLFDARPFFSSTRQFDAKDFIEPGGTGIQLFDFTAQNKARFKSIVPGQNVFLQEINPGELKLDVTADIGFEDVSLIDMGSFTEDPDATPNP